MQMAKKQSMGRQKIKIAKIEIKNHLQVTFSKRRSGLYKKAHELGTLTGVELAIIVFSPAGKVFSFGNPNVDYIIDRFISRNKNLSHQPQPPLTRSGGAITLVEAHRNSNSVRQLNAQLTQIVNELEAEKKRGEAFDQMRKARQSQYWWESPIHELGLDELEQLRDSMKDLKKNVIDQAGIAMSEASDSSSLFFGLNNNAGPVPATGSGSFFHPYETKPTGAALFSSVTPNIYSYGGGYHEQGLF